MGRHREEDDESQDYSDEQNDEQKVQIRKPKVERIDKFKNFKKIVINISMTQYSVVSDVAEELDWKIQTSNEAGDWDVYWTDFAIDPDVLIKMHLFQKINHYPGIHVIARKNLLGMNLMSLRAKFPDQYNFFPLTWMLPLQYAEFRSYYESKPKGKARTYIAKPEADCQGRGIFLTRKIEQLENGKHYVIQRYLARPYLIDGLKFDLRIYVLLCGTNPLRLYMFEQGLARLATEQYVEPNTSNLEKQYVHLTNYAINKHNPKFVFNNNANNMGIGHKRSLSCVFKQLASKGINIDELKEKINDVAIKTIICGLPLMSHQYKFSQPEDYSGNVCFHILGLDIMMNNKGQPVLLEVNHTPSFTTDTPLDHKIKFNLIKDTLTLMNVNVQTKNELFNKAKELSQNRLLTGKRQIFEGKEREAAIQEAQRLRDQYEDKHLGGFTRIFPLKDEQKMKKYNTIIQAANKAYFEQNGSIRMKMMEKQAKKLIRSDMKQMKKDKQAKNANPPAMETISEGEGLNRVKQANNGGNSENKISHTAEIRFKDGQIGRDDLYQSIDPTVKSQSGFQRKSELIASPDLSKKYSDRTDRQKLTESIIKIRKFESVENPGNPSTNPIRDGTTKDSRTSIENKSTPNRKFYYKDQIPSTPHAQMVSQATPNQRDRIKSNTVVKNPTNRQSGRPNQQLPNIIDNIIANNDISSLLRRQEKLIAIHKHPNPKVQSKSGKIYDHIARDIREMIDKKSNNHGGYVMPRLMNINLQNQRRSTQNPGASLPLYRRNLGNLSSPFSNE